MLRGNWLQRRENNLFRTVRYGHVSVWLGLRDSEKYIYISNRRQRIETNFLTSIYGHVSVWLHLSYNSYKTLVTFFIYNFLLNVFVLISHYNRVTDATVIITNVTLVIFMNTLNILDHFYALSQLIGLYTRFLCPICG